jgi:hypothetical protein
LGQVEISKASQEKRGTTRKGGKTYLQEQKGEECKGEEREGPEKRGGKHTFRRGMQGDDSLVNSEGVNEFQLKLKTPVEIFTGQFFVR